MGQILLVDGDAAAGELVRECMKERGHHVTSALRGEQAVELNREHRFDMVLLDVILPGIHGFETARRIRNQAGSESMPIVFVSSIGDQSSRHLGLSMGADFLTKPIDPIELSTRVSNLLAAQHFSTSLVRKNADLVELDRHKEELSAMIVHDLRNPIGIIQCNLEYLSESLASADPEIVAAVRDCHVAGRRALRLLGNLLDVTRIENHQFVLQREMVELGELLASFTELLQAQARERHAEFQVRCEPSLWASIDRDVIERVLGNVLDNALRYVSRGGRIELRGAAGNGGVELRIGNTGPTIPVAARASVFEKFGRAEGANRTNLGLGLYFCRLAVEAHGGRIWIEDEPDLPTVFVLHLPAPAR